MDTIYHYMFYLMWGIYLIYWWLKSSDVKESERKESMPSRIVRFGVIVLAIVLLASPQISFVFLGDHFLELGTARFWLGCLLTGVGLLFSVWGRRHLGKNWSQVVAIKEDHELITSGPYSLVRHPIYSGLLLGFVGSAVALGQVRGLIAVGLIFGVLWYKLRFEEKLLREHFGKAYQEYCVRVKALVPYLL